jgi:hypothetical protein
MATRLQIRQGTNTENNNFTGASGELTFDITNKEIRIHDGTTQGGITIANKQLLDTKLDKNISLNYSHITNCITEIPQDIKLELADGVLTLKAGSKVYVPNGAGVFDVITIKNDIISTASTNGTHLIGLAQGFGSLASYINTTSTFKEPTTLSNGLTWYDLSNNIIKRAWGGSWQDSLFSLPLAVITVSNGAIASIDQIFNGFGYFDSRLFALPGVKGLIPDGRNEDGTLKNIEFESTKVTITSVGLDDDTYNLVMTTNGRIDQCAGFRYDPEHNYNYNYDWDATVCNCGVCTTEVDKITSFKPNTVFHAVDYNDSNYISQQGMPSSKYVNIPADKFGTTGTAHTAPGNGYFVIRTVANIADCTLTFQSAQEPYYGNSLFIPKGNDGRLFVPVKKDDQVMLYYTNLGTGTGDQATVFNFVYSQGQ